MNAGGCSSVMGVKKIKRKKQERGARMGLWNWVWAGSTHEPRVGSGGV